jgi:hypothetical protein
VIVLFVVYLSVFLLDELVVFGAAVATMRAMKLQEHHGRELKLISGVVMVGLAVVMATRPTLMESLRGALVVFGVNALVAAAALAGQRVLLHHR